MDHKYFAYGSNLVIERITERLGKVKFLGPASIEDLRLSFNKLGEDGSGKCNIVKSQGDFVYGVVYQISKLQKEMLDKFEQGYRTMSLQIPNNLDVAAHDPKNLIDHACNLKLDDVDVIVVSACVQMPSLSIIPKLEQITKKPVISAAVCTVYNMLKSLNLEPIVPDAGTLLAGDY